MLGHGCLGTKGRASSSNGGGGGGGELKGQAVSEDHGSV